MTTLSVIRTELARYQPATSLPPERPPNEAAVALVLHEPVGGVPELLFIERSKREGDPCMPQAAGARFPNATRAGHAQLRLQQEMHWPSLYSQNSCTNVAQKSDPIGRAKLIPLESFVVWTLRIKPNKRILVLSFLMRQ